MTCSFKSRVEVDEVPEPVIFSCFDKGTLHEKWPKYGVFFTVFSRIQSEFGKTQSSKNSVFEDFT